MEGCEVVRKRNWAFRIREWIDAQVGSDVAPACGSYGGGTGMYQV